MATYFCVNSSIGGAVWNSSNTTIWSTTSGLASAGAGPPAAADLTVFDANSGGGTVTVASSINTTNTINTITAGAFTGTLDFATNNPSITISNQFSVTGTGVRTISLGSGTYTFTMTNQNVWDATTTTNLTLNASLATFLVTSPANSNLQTFAGGNITNYGTLSIGSRTNGSMVNVTGNNTFVSVLISAPASLIFGNAATNTITNAVSWIGTSSNPIYVGASNTATSINTAAGSSMNWLAIRSIAFTNTPTANNSFDLKGNIGITINAPSSGGGTSGGFVIGS